MIYWLQHRKTRHLGGGVGITAGTSGQSAGSIPGIALRSVSRPGARDRGGSAGSLLPNVPDLLGRIDLVMETQDALHIVDFKTSRCRWSDDQVAESSGQLLLYSQLAGDLCPKPVKMSFAVLTKTKSPDVAYMK